jgi:quaternary ammonium compound-resistance protein SugE
MAWIILLIAGLLEVVWAIGLKFTIAAMVVSMLLLANAMKTLPAGTAYAVWTGIGAVGAAIMGMVLLGESTNIARIISLCLIVVGILGLKFSSH